MNYETTSLNPVLKQPDYGQMDLSTGELEPQLILMPFWDNNAPEALPIFLLDDDDADDDMGEDEGFDELDDDFDDDFDDDEDDEYDDEEDDYEDEDDYDYEDDIDYDDFDE